MRKGYTKVLITEIVMIIILLINSFVVNILSNYTLVLFLFLALCLFKIFFDFEKDKHRNTNDILIYLAIYLIITIIIYYALGLITGYISMPNYYNSYGIFTFIIPTFLEIVLSEFLRYQLLRKSEGNFKLVVLTTIVFILVDVSSSIYYGDFYSGYSILVFAGLTLIPSIFRNIFCTYTSSKTGYKPALLLSLCFGLYKYLLPILPNYSEYLQSMFYLISLTSISFLIFKILKNDSGAQEETNSKAYKKKVMAGYIAEILIALVLIYFVSGYFSYYAIAIASNSMKPTFERGSVVIIKKIEGRHEELEVGNIIAYHYGNKIIAHRIAKITEIDGTRYFYTQGDANKNIDNYVVKEEMIMGTINHYIPFIGYPTILLNELFTD